MNLRSLLHDEENEGGGGFNAVGAGNGAVPVVKRLTRGPIPAMGLSARSRDIVLDILGIAEGKSDSEDEDDVD